MKKLISIIISIAMVTSLCGYALATQSDSALTFTDVDASTTQGAAIYKLAQNGIINGNGDGTFAPNRPVKRAELCKMINNIWSYTEPSADAFLDVSESNWYYTHVKIAKKAGYINGFEDGTFRGESYVTREQACAILVRVAKLYDLGLPITITDAVSPWAEKDVKTVIANTFIALEDGGKFRATEPMTRGELALLLDDFVVVKAPDTSDATEEDKDTSSSENESASSKPSSGSSKPSSGSSKPSSGSSGSNSGSSDSENDEENNYYPGIDETEEFDEAKQKEVVENLKALLEELDIVAGLPWITFTEKENGVLDIIKATVNKTLADAEKGIKIYEEDYVYKAYKSDVESVRSICKQMEETGEFEAFKTKLKELPIYLLEYLSETMFGVDVQDYM